MLNVPKLDNLSYQEIFERARGKVAAMTGEWTDLNYHDPGITTLSTFAWLTDTLNYYINASGEQHRLKYMKLLGIRPQREAASCILDLCGAEEYCLPQGVQMMAGDIPFEVVKTAEGRANHLVKLYNEVAGVKWDLSEIAGIDGQYATVFTKKKDVESTVYFGFAQPLCGEVSFYLLVDSLPNRNQFDEGFSLAQLAFEYFDGTQWCAATLLRDETNQFLTDGMVCVQLASATALCEQASLAPAYYLRCKLIENEYDVLPRLGGVTLNYAFAKQQTSYVRALPLQETAQGEYAIDWYVQPTDALTIWVQEGDAFACWYDVHYAEGNRCEVLPGAYPWQRKVRFDALDAANCAAQGAKMLAVVTKQEAQRAAVLGTTIGYAEERLALDAENVYELTLGLVDASAGYPKMEIWHYVDDLAVANYDEPAFTIDREQRQVVFGDGMHGLQAPAKREVIAITLSTSKFEQGNVVKESLNLLKHTLETVSAVKNITAADGGVDCQSSTQLERQIKDKMDTVTRAVTAEDYQKIVKATPGLMIDAVTVVPMGVYADCYAQKMTHNTVVIVVKPDDASACPVLGERYRRMIRAHLEQYRLLTTDVRVESARYVYVSVGGRICLRGSNQRIRKEVEACIKTFLDGSSIGAFGRTVSLNKLFAAIERLDGVAKVEQLTLEYTGIGGQKNQHGDVVLHPDALSYPDRIQLEFANW